MLEARGLVKRYEDGVLALDLVSFAVRAGEIYAMLGANGAGKTTTINIFLNFVEPTEGEALVDGIVTHKDPLAAKERLAYVSENVMLYPNFTAIQNLEFFARLAGKTEVTRDECRDVLRRVGLQDDAHAKRLKGFSKGMRQKCGIAIAILKDAPAILLDEPTSGLDPKAGFEFLNLLAILRSEGKAILMSTHDIFRAKEIADTVGIMSAGRLALQRPASELAGQDLEQLYLQHMAGHVERAA
ncbi:MAG: ABC transporter ATP-binding protein [Ignavibacteria bacterium GWA2_55_11]|nr:MAG: ABC transporter ATP-binding protein [Ignavibacteria bacterium GWA2_55_11]OGU46736.1 MAG: ABC transporter ATP-binding protein [Ignavibacteria bacterium GWC2_56_12]OGU64718.1 MAG: ABC transporter ATP-binding protein [Ignavibacteria bacterium RIFCSPHIGHO2_02_FULL_56_12]OGU71612.1 MAG: ABC transporter ATP-binding protein [Ignavibacteria bacterium RIFCSPLOWO2_12_FULL_56_21]OGU73351.1 MAG: ABC transporter ATP-binding protein [Ignavibacteria bacterium RIFCSPLOWO2_02_FULL_55_14]HAV24408.1 ABC 